MRYSTKPYLAILLVFALFICWRVGAAYSVDKVPDIPVSEEELREDFPYLAITSMDQETEMTDPVELNLSKLSDGYEITEAGEYHLTGELQGTLLINAPDQNVHLFLDNISITSKSGPALFCQEANKLVITVLPDTDNTLSDSGYYPVEEEPVSCIYSKSDTTFNGSGNLTVNGYYKDAVRCNDVIKMLDDVHYALKCKRTAVHGTDGILVTGGSFVISSEKFGFKSTKSGDGGRGNIIVSGGELSVIAGSYTFVTYKADLYVYDCTIYQRSVMSAYDVGGTALVQEGCVQ